eukprot:7139636-Pyramimonas_sp.AAC.1
MSLPCHRHVSADAKALLGVHRADRARTSTGTVRRPAFSRRYSGSCQRVFRVLGFGAKAGQWSMAPVTTTGQPPPPSAHM